MEEGNAAFSRPFQLDVRDLKATNVLNYTQLLTRPMIREILFVCEYLEQLKYQPPAVHRPCTFLLAGTPQSLSWAKKAWILETAPSARTLHFEVQHAGKIS